jgi:hypothetical protein
MNGSDEDDIPLINVVCHHHMVCHQGLLKMGNTIQNWKSFLQDQISTSDIVPELNLNSISHLVSHKSGKKIKKKKSLHPILKIFHTSNS